jgi:hypothetical protein
MSQGRPNFIRVFFPDMKGDKMNRTNTANEALAALYVVLALTPACAGSYETSSKTAAR